MISFLISFVVLAVNLPALSLIDNLYFLPHFSSCQLACTPAPPPTIPGISGRIGTLAVCTTSTAGSPLGRLFVLRSCLQSAKLKYFIILLICLEGIVAKVGRVIAHYA